MDYRPRRRGPAIQRRVRSPGVVLLPPLFNLGLLQRVEDLPIQAFISQFSVEALYQRVLDRCGIILYQNYN